MADYRTTIMGTTGLVGYWRLGEAAGVATAADERGLYPGTYTGDASHLAGPTRGQPGATIDGNTAAQFAIGEWINVPHATALNLADVWTIEVWIKLATLLLLRERDAITPLPGDEPDPRFAGYRGILSKGDHAYYMRVNASGYIETVKGNDWVIRTSSVPITVGVWQHVVGTKNATASAIFIDGVDRSGAVGNSGALVNSTFPIVIGADISGANVYREGYQGWIDEAAVYNVALSPATILAHYQAATEVPARPRSYAVVM